MELNQLVLVEFGKPHCIDLFRFGTDESGAVRRTTVTLLLPLVALVVYVPGALQLVVERQLRVGGDIFDSKESHPSVAQHGPLLRLAIRMARMVHEASQVAARPGIDHPLVVQGEEVVGLIPCVLFSFETPLEFLVVNQLPAVLYDKVSLLNSCAGLEAPALAVGFERVEGWGEALLKTLVRAIGTADARMTFGQKHPVQN